MNNHIPLDDIIAEEMQDPAFAAAWQRIEKEGLRPEPAGAKAKEMLWQMLPAGDRHVQMAHTDIALALAGHRKVDYALFFDETGDDEDNPLLLVAGVAPARSLGLWIFQKEDYPDEDLEQAISDWWGEEESQRYPAIVLKTPGFSASDWENGARRPVDQIVIRWL